MSELNNNYEEQLAPFVQMIEQVMALPDENLNEDIINNFKGQLHAQFDDSTVERMVNQIIMQYNNANLSRAQVVKANNTAKELLASLTSELKPSEFKQAILDEVFSLTYGILDTASERYHLYDIELPIALSDGAQAPAYAHADDAAADLYAYETVTVKAHTYGNFIHTGVRIGLPEGWRATILPRSSVGAKTPLRLSNSQGLIDTSYRGEIMVLFDNISDSDYTINKGDRIAQMEVKPIHRFKAKIVEKLDETDRGEGGFGSTGK